MQEDKIVVGLDIGTKEVSIIVGRQDEFGQLEILGSGIAKSDGVIKGAITNIEKIVRSVNIALHESEGQSGINIGEVIVGIAGQEIKGSTHRGNIMKSSQSDEFNIYDVQRLINDMYKTATPPGTEIIDVIPQEYLIDYDLTTKDPVGTIGARLEGEFQIITAPTKDVAVINKSLQRASMTSPEGLICDRIIVNSLASSLAVLSEEDKDAGVALIDIGSGTTDIAVFYDGILRYTTVIPYGGDIITSDIRQGCMVTQQQAEQLKTKFGKALAEKIRDNEVISIPGLRGRPAKEISRKNLGYIIEARLQDIIELIDWELTNSGYRNHLAAGIVITGGTAQMENIEALFELMTGLDTQVGIPNIHLGRGRSANVKLPKFATAIGLALSGIRALDKRENQYIEQQYTQMQNNRSEMPSNVIPEKMPEVEVGLTKTKFSFNRFIHKTKNFLMDDFNKNDY